jgi:hypothetical protein
MPDAEVIRALSGLMLGFLIGIPFSLARAAGADHPAPASDINRS